MNDYTKNKTDQNEFVKKAELCSELEALGLDKKEIDLRLFLLHLKRDNNGFLGKYKKEIFESLTEFVGVYSAKRLLEVYEDDISMFYKKGWSPELAALAMIHSY